LYVTKNTLKKTKKIADAKPAKLPAANGSGMRVQKKYCTSEAWQGNPFNFRPRAPRGNESSANRQQHVILCNALFERHGETAFLKSAVKRSFTTTRPGSNLNWWLRRKRSCPPDVSPVVGVAFFMHKIICNAIFFLHFSALQQI
jgi:hypothetical protein